MLKPKEISYIHAEGYPAAEMKHGPIALIDKNANGDSDCNPRSYISQNYQQHRETKARGGKIIAIVAENDKEASKVADHVIRVPMSVECLMPVIISVPLQLLAYYIAINKGCDVDQPRNLAKSVTVE